MSYWKALNKNILFQVVPTIACLICAGTLPGIFSDGLCGILAGIVFGMSFWRSTLRIFWRSFWDFSGSLLCLAIFTSHLLALCLAFFLPFYPAYLLSGESSGALSGKSCGVLFSIQLRHGAAHSAREVPVEARPAATEGIASCGEGAVGQWDVKDVERLGVNWGGAGSLL